MRIRWDGRTIAAVAVTALLWGSSFAGIRAALQAYAPGHVILLRFLIASTVLVVYAAVKRMRMPALRDWPAIALVGLAGVTIYQTALSYGELTVTAGSASLIVASGPVFTAIFASAFLGERLRAWGWAGMAVSFAGIVLIALGERQGVALNVGALLTLVAAIITGAYNVLQKPLLRKYSALQVTACAMWIGTLTLLVFAPGLGAAVRSAPREATLAVVFLGLFPAAVSYVTWSYVLSRVPASVAGSFLYTVPVLGVLIAWAWLGEVPPALALVGGIVSLVGIVMVNTWGRRPAAQVDAVQPTGDAECAARTRVEVKPPERAEV